MDFSSIGLVISFAVLVIAAFALGWNIRHNYAHGAKLRISAEIVEKPKNKSESLKGKYIVVSVFNEGSKKLQITALWAANISFFRKLLLRGTGRRLKTLPLFQLPKDVMPGEKGELFLPFHEDCFLNEKFNKLGIMDSFDRELWVPASQLSGFYEEYEKAFHPH